MNCGLGVVPNGPAEAHPDRHSSNFVQSHTPEEGNLVSSCL